MSQSIRTLVIALLVVSISSITLCLQDPKPDPKQDPKQDRGIGIRPTETKTTTEQTKSGGAKPEIVLQAGITIPQTQIAFSPDGRLLASMGMFGNSVKLWEIATGRLLRQLESSIPNMGASSMARPFQFTQDGKMLVAMADDRLRRWEVETGRELNSTLVASGKDASTVLLSDDGRTLAARSVNAARVRLWDVAGGRELPVLTLQENEQFADQQNSIALSPDGKLLAALTETTKGSTKGVETRLQAMIWDVTTGRTTKTLKLETRIVGFGVSPQTEGSVLFTPDGASIAIRNEDSIKFFDVNSGQEVKTLAAPKLFANPNDELAFFKAEFAFSPDRRMIALLGDEHKIRLMDAASGSTLNSLSGHDKDVVALAFSADSKLFASSGVDNQIKLWDAATGREVRSFTGSSVSTRDLAFSTDGKTLTIAGQQSVSAWELTTGGVKRTLSLPAGYGEAAIGPLEQRPAILSSDGRYLISGNNSDPNAKVWETTTGKEVQTISLGQGKELSNAAFARDSGTVVVAENDRRKSKATTATPPPPQNAPAATAPMAMPDITQMMEEMRKDPKKAQERMKQMQEQMKKVGEAMKNGDLSAGMNAMQTMGIAMPGMNRNRPANNLRMIEVSSGRALQTVPLPSSFFDSVGASSMSSTSLSVSPDGRMVASANGAGGAVVLRDMTSGQELRTLKAPLMLGVNSIAWSRNGKRLASAHWGLGRSVNDPNGAGDFSFEDMKFTIKIWDPQTGNEIKSLGGHGNFVGALTFSPDDRVLASGSFDSTIKLWDAASGSELATFKGHSGSITALAFTPNGNFLVSGSDDGSTRLWETATGKLTATIVTLNEGDDWLVVTPDGLFDGSPAGWKQLLWRFSPALYDVAPVEIFFNEYFRPGLLPDLIAGRKVAAAVDISQKDRRQPVVTLESADQADISARTVKLKIGVTNAPAGAQDLRLFRNGSLVKVWRGDVLGGQPSVNLETTVNVVAGRNQFTAYAFNRDNVKSSDATLLLKGADSLKRPATMHLLVVGVNKYANSAYDLKYAVADARAFGEELERQQRKLARYERFEVTSLVDQEATKANVLYALKRFGGDAGEAPAGSPAALQNIKPVEPEDAVVIYYAGHGTAQGQRFYLIPHDLGYTGSRTELDQAGLQQILTHSISDLEIEQSVTGLDAGLLLMVIDACNSGQALESEEKRRGPMNSKGLAQLAYEKGMYILTAAQSYQAALEAEQLGHGYLTFALVEEGLKSKAADIEPTDGQVMLREWLDYATERVPQMQETKMREGRGVGVGVAFVEGEQKVQDIDKRSLQRPRVFYRREEEAQPLIVARP
jgi:WD40 repeat protein